MKFIEDKGVVIGLDKIDKLWLDKHKNLKVIGAPSTGLDHIDLDECSKRGIKIISLKDFPEFTKTITSTAEHTIGLIISLLRNYKLAFNHPFMSRESYTGFILRDKVLGLIGGNGRVGSQVAKIAVNFGAKIVIWDNNTSFINLSEFLSYSDIISLHIPLDGNENYFTKDMFQSMKPTSLLINTSRNAIIEPGALIESLRNKTIAGAAIDFIDDVELIEYSVKNNNLILTNHMGGNTFEDQTLTENFILNEVKKYLVI